ncbi:MAG: hypothetical protein ACK52I_27845, partial [Pseudomonadota bacterium]
RGAGRGAGSIKPAHGRARSALRAKRQRRRLFGTGVSENALQRAKTGSPRGSRACSAGRRLHAID